MCDDSNKLRKNKIHCLKFTDCKKTDKKTKTAKKIYFKERGKKRFCEPTVGNPAVIAVGADAHQRLSRYEALAGAVWRRTSKYLRKRKRKKEEGKRRLVKRRRKKRLAADKI